MYIWLYLFIYIWTVCVWSVCVCMFACVSVCVSVHFKAWFPPMRLTYSHIHSYKNKFNLIGGNALNNLKKVILQFFVILFGYSHKNNMKMFSFYSCNILIRLMRSKEDRRNICYFCPQFLKMNEKSKFRHFRTW